MAKSDILLRAARAYQGKAAQDKALKEFEAGLDAKKLAAFAKAFGLEQDGGPRPVPAGCIEMVKGFEGFRADAYPDPVSKGKPYTIGFGTTVYPSGKVVQLGDKITKAQADEYLLHELSGFAKDVEGLVKLPLNDNQFGALTSFCYNLGAGSLKASTLLKKLNAGDYLAAAEQFMAWNKARNKKGELVEVAGLTRRRKAERELFLKHV